MSKKSPQLRFEGFTDAWEERKLIEVADYRNGKAHEKDISEAGDYIVVNSKFVSTNGLVKKYSDEMIAPLSKNEIAFVLSDVPNGRAIARTFLINEENKYSLNQRIAGITPHADTNSYFLHSLMNRNHYFLRFDDGVSQTNLSKKEVEKWVELYPSYGEQQKIGSFFKQLDDTIALHQRKLDLLKEQKKGYLQKMFPKNGSKIPELRFEGFTGDWQERKLGDLLDEGVILSQSDGNHGELYPKSSEFAKSGIPYLSASNLKNNEIDYSEVKYLPIDRAEKFKKGVAKKGDVLLAHNATVGPSVLLRTDYPFVILSTTLTLYRINEEKMDNIFFLNSIRSSNIQNQLKKMMKQTTRNQVPILAQRTMTICYSTDIKEQKKIGSFFSLLDNTIALHQRKLDLLKEQKKGFLQKMFI